MTQEQAILKAIAARLDYALKQTSDDPAGAYAGDRALRREVKVILDEVRSRIRQDEALTK